ncbi:hypothetical protein R1flu_006726 [Riccia fluitans]|uniref:Uncharacterized protein n=1 Tax=Riccia fluitans TaxID=41844 RepID=A0ABD1YZV3_9MARC
MTYLPAPSLAYFGACTKSELDPPGSLVLAADESTTHHCTSCPALQNQRFTTAPAYTEENEEKKKQWRRSKGKRYRRKERGEGR